ncbi:hypothetical protein V5799_009114 [Amblyomma americanum]|uniref:Lipase domain-containing protein n=1 Tax=Amblyomma americanum TaxID=6943 RepID=A0AAQ4FCN1_AMBAM
MYSSNPSVLKPERVHLVGFSLGAHAAGFCGRHFYNSTQQQLGRITGLDPAGPLFENPNISLSSSDVTFVDVIHTNGGPINDLKFGRKNPMGHVDFYPNGGSDQPGCPTDSNRKKRSPLPQQPEPEPKKPTAGSPEFAMYECAMRLIQGEEPMVLLRVSESLNETSQTRCTESTFVAKVSGGASRRIEYLTPAIPGSVIVNITLQTGSNDTVMIRMDARGKFDAHRE